jgi:hypothetical protein
MFLPTYTGPFALEPFALDLSGKLADAVVFVFSTH